MTVLSVVEGDITKLAVDAVVNAANSSLLGGGGVDGAIHRAAGPALLAECQHIRARQGGCRPGEAVITGAGDLPCRFVIHTVGPVWSASEAEDHDRTLASCYRSSLDLADEAGAATVAFPAISTGIYGFPKDRAAGVAVATVRSWTARHDETSVQGIQFVCFGAPDAALYRRLLLQ